MSDYPSINEGHIQPGDIVITRSVTHVLINRETGKRTGSFTFGPGKTNKHQHMMLLYMGAPDLKARDQEDIEKLVATSILCAARGIREQYPQHAASFDECVRVAEAVAP